MLATVVLVEKEDAIDEDVCCLDYVGASKEDTMSFGSSAGERRRLAPRQSQMYLLMYPRLDVVPWMR